VDREVERLQVLSAVCSEWEEAAGHIVLARARSRVSVLGRRHASRWWAAGQPVDQVVQMFGLEVSPETQEIAAAIWNDCERRDRPWEEPEVGSHCEVVETRRPAEGRKLV
jgi:uncharacterized protein (DUF2342 family)